MVAGMKFSRLAARFNRPSGIARLMDDLGEALAGDADTLMLGGGNPAHIPAIERHFKMALQRLLDDPARLAHTLGNYEAPGGNAEFIKALAELMNRQYQWGLKPENVVLTVGSQAAFFYLFNLLSGADDAGRQRQILLPITPEYIGYADLGLSDGLFYAHRPLIERLDDHFFKYHVDFADLAVPDNTAAMCVSRPTNPTGNVLSDTELAGLIELARANDIPLIIDNAYGAPFPNIIFTETRPVWNENIIYCMSLSKLGLPGVRTGIVIATEAITDLIRKMNAIIHLATANFGPALAGELVQSGEIVTLSRSVIRPYYAARREHAVRLIKRELAGLDYYIHQPEGAIFLWLWLPGLPITAEALYERLKAKGVLLIPGSHFFPGLKEDWAHRRQCVRITYSMDERVVARGIRLIAKELKVLFG